MSDCGSIMTNKSDLFTDFPTDVDPSIHTGIFELLVSEKISRKHVCQ